MPYLSASSGFAVIAINLLLSPDHSKAFFKFIIVSSVVNDFEETIKTVFSDSKNFVL